LIGSYIVTELLDTDLKRVLDKEHAKLTEDHFKLFLYQTLRAMHYMHSANILHRDLVAHFNLLRETY
jgi:mitogen-activated protein kinase 1/3